MNVVDGRPEPLGTDGYAAQRQVATVPETRRTNFTREAISKARKIMMVGGIVIGLAVTGCSSNSGTREMPNTPTPSAGALPAGSSADYNWVGEYKDIRATRASVDLTQAEPKLAANDEHSLAELDLISPEGPSDRVELGWTVDYRLNGNRKSDLFVSDTVNGDTRYAQQGGGFVQVSKEVRPGSAVKPGETGSYTIQYDANNGGRWVVIYNGREVGYYPESLWGGKFKQSAMLDTYGEVDSPPSTCTPPMGNGELGSSPGSTRISNVMADESLVAQPIPYTSSGIASSLNDASPLESSTLNNRPNLPYDYGMMTATSLPFGGPGTC